MIDLRGRWPFGGNPVSPLSVEEPRLAYPPALAAVEILASVSDDVYAEFRKFLSERGALRDWRCDKAMLDMGTDGLLRLSSAAPIGAFLDFDHSINTADGTAECSRAAPRSSRIIDPAPGELKNVLSGAFVEKISPLVLNAEIRLCATSLEVDGRRSEMSFERDALEEHIAWMRLVRFLLCCQVLFGLDYKHVWGNLHGHIGVVLSESAGQIAQLLLRMPQYLALKATLSEGAVLGDYYLSSYICAVLARLEAVSGEAVQWRTRSARGPGACTLLGVAYSRENASKARKQDDAGAKLSKLIQVDGFPSTFGQVPSQLAHGADWALCNHAREAAIQRVRWIKHVWTAACGKLAAANLIKEPDFYPFGVTGASLPGGGKHPPHITHQDGSSFDYTIAKSYKVVFSPRRREGGVLIKEVSERRSSFPDLERDVFSGELALAAEDYGTEQAYYDMLNVSPVEDWASPRDYADMLGRKLEDEVNAKIGRLFSFVVFMTFPKYIIFASDAAAKGAYDDFKVILERLAQKEEGKASMLRAIAVFLGKINPQGWRTPANRRDPAKEEESRLKHRDHWHVDYNSDWLGDEGVIRSATPDDAAMVSEHFRCVKEGLWQDLLKEEIKDLFGLEVDGF